MRSAEAEFISFVRNRMSLTLSGEIKSKLGLACVGLAGEAGGVVSHVTMSGELRVALVAIPGNTRKKAGNPLTSCG